MNICKISCIYCVHDYINYYTSILSNKTKCIICGAVAEDVHHISQKSLADEAGFIGHFHQNSKHNLIPLCKEHQKLKFEEQLSKAKEVKDIKKILLDDW